MTILRETIKNIIKKHLMGKKGLCFGQNLTAVGWVNGTLPALYEEDGMIELPTSDCSNSGFAVGCALVGKKVIYIVRYQGFQWLNSSFLVNYSAKSKEMWGKPCPMFVRSIAKCGGAGPVASNSIASLFYHMPGCKVSFPMTSVEYQNVYDQFMKDDDVYYVSEHANSYVNSEEFEDKILKKSDIVLCPIGISRFEVEKTQNILKNDGINASIFHLIQIKPFIEKDGMMETIKKSKYGAVVIIDEYPNGIGK